MGNEVRTFSSTVRDAASQAAEAPGFGATGAAIYAEAVGGLSPAAAAMIPQAASVRRNVANVKRRVLPEGNQQEPDNANDVVIPGALWNTHNNEEFVLHDSLGEDNVRFFIFGTPTSLLFLNVSNSVIMDDTFSSTPKQFAQLYTVHGSQSDKTEFKLNRCHVPTYYCPTRPRRHTFVHSLHFVCLSPVDGIAQNTEYNNIDATNLKSSRNAF